MKKMIAMIALIATIGTIACANSVAQKEGEKKTESSSTDSSSSSTSSAASQGRGTASLDMEGGTVSISFGRPELKGRDVLSLLNPGEEWRMGADGATTMTSAVDLKFGDKVVPKGEYVLTARRMEEKKWSLVIKRDGTPVAEAPLAFENVSETAEQMTITLEKTESGGRFKLHWGKFTLTTDFQKA